MSPPPYPYWNYGELGPRFGLGELAEPTPAELARREAARLAFRASPRGRFLAALDRLAELPSPAGLSAAAAAARSAYTRGFSAGASLNPAELACARRELEPFAQAAEALAALAAIEAEVPADSTTGEAA